MALPASGPISFNNINVELGVSGTTQASLGQTSYRNLAGVASGQISMSNFYGKSNQFAFTISSNQTNANLRSLAVAAGWDQSSQVVATINSGITISSSSTGTPALTIDGSFPGGVTLVNNGTIIGRGGNGGRGAQPGPVAGSGGGLGVSVSSAVSINNVGRISGGGGGGGGGGVRYITFGKSPSDFGGGGGGGGIGVSSGGAGGFGAQTGGAGTLTTAGNGGTGQYINGYYGWSGGAGGSYGAGGASGVNGASGGAAGGCLSGNSFVTWIAFGTRNGGVT